MARENEQMTKTILGKFIVEECVKLNEKPFDFKEIKPLIDSCSYLVSQIELCDSQIKTFSEKLKEMDKFNTEEPDHAFSYEEQEFKVVQSMLDDSNRQKELFTKQLIEAIEKL
jgi:RNA processing factor Prp31